MRIRNKLYGYLKKGDIKSFWIVFSKAKDDILILLLDRIAFFFPDDIFIKVKFRLALGCWPDIKHPKSFNEKLQWLKLYDRKSEYTQMVDKAEAKKWVSERIGEEYIIPTIGVWDTVDDIDWSMLPNQFVLKCTHDSGGIVICKDKTILDIEKTKITLNNYLHRRYFSQNREWPYKNVKPRIIAEQYMEDETGELRDFKFFCFNGEVKALFIASDRTKDIETKFDFFDENFHHLPIKNGHPNAEVTPSKPTCFEEMKGLASILSKGIPHLRVDFYEIRGKVFFGELTFFHWSGFVPFEPKEWDYKFGEWISLPNKAGRK